MKIEEISIGQVVIHPFGGIGVVKRITNNGLVAVQSKRFDYNKEGNDTVLFKPSSLSR